MYSYLYNSPIGQITVASDGKHIVGLWFIGQKYYMEPYLNCTFQSNNDLEVFKKVKEWLDAYFRGENPSMSGIGVKLFGSDFRIRVWDLLKEIPYGKTITYGELSKTYCERYKVSYMSSQAIGGAIAHNPVCILIPCHRVVGAGKKLTGYAAGIRTKEKLLNLEDKKL